MKKILSIIILNYFRLFAHLQLKKNPRATIIGVTGTSGKTSASLAISTILQTRGVVKHSSGANSQSGISLDILGLHPVSYSLFDWCRLIILAPIRYLTFFDHYDYYVVEMGIDGPSVPRNMSYLLSIVRPHIGVVLNAGLAHSASFDHLVKDKDPIRREQKLIKLIAKEKMQLVRGLQSQGVAIVNIDQPELAICLKDITSRKLMLGKTKKADLMILSTTLSRDGFTEIFRYQGRLYKLKLPELFPEVYGYTFASAIAVASSLGIPPSTSLKALSTYHSPSGRLRIFEGIKDTTIIDSSYNASPTSVHESLKLLKKIAGKNHRVGIIGDMNELGLNAKHTHKLLADWLRQYCDEVILFGDLTKEYVLPVLVAHKFKVKHFSTMKELNSYTINNLSSNSYVLVKGSQNGILLERAVESLLLHKSDTARLCRRGKYWDRIRRNTP